MRSGAGCAKFRPYKREDFAWLSTAQKYQKINKSAPKSHESDNKWPNPEIRQNFEMVGTLRSVIFLSVSVSLPICHHPII